MFTNISTYLNKEDYRISIINSGVHILNYTKVLDITSLVCLIYINNKKIKITGEDLILSKLDKKELLIKGKIKRVEIDE